MTDRYDLRNQESQDGGASYAALPGTAQQGHVPHNSTPMKSRIAPGREIPGCHPSRWLWELFNNAFTTCDMFARARQADLASEFAWEHPHRLVINGNQSYVLSSSRQLSSVCLDCSFHFVFKMAWKEACSDSKCHPSQACWPPSDNAFPWHHLLWVGSDSDTNIAADRSKYYPLLAREFFVCTAPPCTLEMILEVSKPRLGSLLNLLRDHDTIRQQLQAARAREPQRYEDAQDDWIMQAPVNLNTYLKNQLETPEGQNPRSIAKRNKRFAVLFGARCAPLFEELEFAEEKLIKDDFDDGTFTPKQPGPVDGPAGTTRLNTYRAYIEDARAEVQCLIHLHGGVAEKPTYCSSVLHTDLGCREHLGVSENPLTKTEPYEGLGVLPSQEREAIVNAYQRQWELMPTKRRFLVDSLMAIANHVDDERLSEYAITQSSVFDSQSQAAFPMEEDGLVPDALRFFNLQPPNSHGAEAILSAFRSRVASEPATASTARSMLMVLVQASNDDMYQAALLMEADSNMSAATAKAILSIDTESLGYDDVTHNAAIKLASSRNPEESQTILDAVESLAQHTSSDQLQTWVYEQRHQNQIPAANGTASTESQAVDFSVPVGLYNIGNTCYLNSLLQYLYTVKPVRDIVVNFDKVKLELGDEKIGERRIGGNKMQIDRGEAVVARAFAEELRTLFHILSSSDKVSTRPSQRLANSVLLATHTLLLESKAVSRVPTPQPPPLPDRPSPAIPSQQTANEIPRTQSNRPQSDASDTTLVDVSETVEKDSKDAPEELRPHRQPEEASGEDKDLEMTDHAPEQPVPSKVDEYNQDTIMPDVIEAEETVDEKVLRALEHQKRSSGTDQQDVEEVMGSMINRLQAGIRPRSTDPSTGIQLEAVFDTFFVTTINYTKKFDEDKYQSETSFDRSLTAFPAPNGPCTLYDALGRNFDAQILEESRLTRYTAIQSLPPVLHILIQRSQSTGGKNNNHVVIPESLYLGRYTDAPRDSVKFDRQVKHWVLADRISDLEAQINKIKAASPSAPANFAQTPSRSSLVDAPQNSDSSGSSETMDDTPQHSIDDWTFDGEVEDDFIVVKSQTASHARIPPPPPVNMEAMADKITQRMFAELDELKEAMQLNIEETDHGDPYSLHAVICHRGAMTSGHYWVWIRDFEQQVWRKYNDDTVQENPDTEAVLKQLSNSEEPYFLCYVKDDVKNDYVNVPRREVPRAAESAADADATQA